MFTRAFHWESNIMYFRIFRFLHFFTIHIWVWWTFMFSRARHWERERGSDFIFLYFCIFAFCIFVFVLFITVLCTIHIHVQQSAPLREREGQGMILSRMWLKIARTGGRPALHISSTGTFLLSSCTFAHLQGRLHTLGGVLHLSSTGTFLYPLHICSLHISPTCTSSILHTLHTSPHIHIGYFFNLFPCERK